MRTEIALQNWNSGNVLAERLTRALLRLEGYEWTEPPDPPDTETLKDLVCRRGTEKWVAATYFPTIQPTFTAIRYKFKSDFRAVTKHKADGFAFFVNQHISLSERESLQKLAGEKLVEIYHIDRMIGLLDAPKGCGIRLEYLRIPMSEEEQWSFWSTMNQDIVRRLADNEKRRGGSGSLSEEPDRSLQSGTEAGQPFEAPFENMEMPTASLSVATLCWLHRTITEDNRLPEAVRGRLRSINVWFGPPGSTIGDAAYAPIPPAQVPGRLADLVAWWRGSHPALVRATRDQVVSALSRLYHGLLRIHPFLDANGRVARVLLDQAARELLNVSVGRELTADAENYFAALRAADEGDMAPLESRISAALV